MPELVLPNFPEKYSPISLGKSETVLLAEAGFAPAMRSAVSAMMLSGVVKSADTFARRLEEVYGKRLPLALKKLAERESQWAKEFSGRTETTWRDLLGQVDLRTVSLPATLDQRFREIFINNHKLYEHLIAVQDIPTRGEPGKLLQFLKEMSLALKEGQVNLNDIYEQVEKGFFQPDLTICADSGHSLYFTTHLPYQLRQLTRDMIVLNTVADFFKTSPRVKDLLASDPQAADSFLNDYLQCRKTRIFASQSWHDFLCRNKADEEIILLFSKKIAATQVLEMALAQNPLTLELLAIESEFIAGLRKTAFEQMSDTTQYLLQQTDIGHCFSDSVPFGLRSKFAAGAKVKPEKNGQKVLIFEDDLDQAAIYSELLNECTQYSSDSSFITATRQDVLRWAKEHQDIGLFLLDISQEEDTLIGIKLAKELIPQMLASRRNSPLHCQIVLWTSSPEHHQAACQEFSEFLNTEYFRENLNIYVGGGSSSSQSHKVSFRIILKSEVAALIDLR